MPKAVMHEDRDFAPDGQGIYDNVTPLPSQLAVTIVVDPLAELSPPGHLGTRQEIERELDIVAAAIRAFHRKQPDQVMREIAGYSARLTELAVLLHRVEGTHGRQYTRIRTQQVERFLVELDRQYKIASRMVEVQRQDLELMK